MHTVDPDVAIDAEAVIGYLGSARRIQLDMRNSDGTLFGRQVDTVVEFILVRLEAPFSEYNISVVERTLNSLLRQRKVSIKDGDKQPLSRITDKADDVEYFGPRTERADAQARGNLERLHSGGYRRVSR